MVEIFDDCLKRISFKLDDSDLILHELSQGRDVIRRRLITFGDDTRKKLGQILTQDKHNHAEQAVHKQFIHNLIILNKKFESVSF